MCWMCDHPGATDQDYHDYLQAKIDRFGWAVQQVEGDGVHPPWAYTVGLTTLGRPELVITGMPIDQACRMLNCVAGFGDRPHPRTAGTREIIVGGLTATIEFVKVARPWAHLYMAVEFYGENIRALQLVHADERGRWPWEASYRGVPGGQPVLGTREVAERR